jgi:hypothetical protein
MPRVIEIALKETLKKPSENEEMSFGAYYAYLDSNVSRRIRTPAGYMPTQLCLQNDIT